MNYDCAPPVCEEPKMREYLTAIRNELTETKLMVQKLILVMFGEDLSKEDPNKCPRIESMNNDIKDISGLTNDVRHMVAGICEKIGM